MLFIVPLIATVLATAGVASIPIEGDKVSKQVGTPGDASSEIWRARTNFNADLLRALDHQTNGRLTGANIVVSPFGIHTALSQALAGAQGETFTQLWNALGYQYTNLDRKTMLSINQETFKNVSQLEHLGLDFANLLVVDEHLKVEPEFLKAIKTSFGSGLLKEDFQTQAEKGTKDINDWVNNITKGKIPKLFDDTLKPNTAAVIANALHLNASWRTPFEEARSYVGKFNLNNGTTKDVIYMNIRAHQLKGARYSVNCGFENVQIPLDKEGRLWFGIMLPNHGMSGFDCCSTFTQFIHMTKERLVDLTFPKFSISQTHHGLKEVLQELGVKDLFDRLKADLSGIDGKKDLFVSDIAHKATVTVDESGVEAAAATAVMTLEPALVQHDAVKFVVDRPFIFSISDRVTNVDFFTGLVYNP